MQKIFIAIGALAAGYCLTFVFPKTVEVERRVEVAVEKQVFVEKPVDRIVEKRVEVPVTRYVDVPARLTKEQETLILEGRSVFGARTLKEAGSALGPKEKTVCVIVDMTSAGRERINAGAIRARVETAFRNCGFKVSDESGVETTIHVQAQMLPIETSREIGLAGQLSVSINQYCTAKLGWNNHVGELRQSPHRLISAQLNDYGQVVFFPVGEYGDIPGAFENLAIEAANDLMKAYERDMVNTPRAR